MPRRKPEPTHYTGVYPSGKVNFQFKLRLPPDETGVRHWEVRGGFTTARAAWEARERRRMELEERRAPITRQTVRELMERYLESVALTIEPATLYRYTAVSNTYIVPYLGHVKVRDLDTPDVRRWIATLATKGKRDGSGLATGTVKLARVVLSMAFNQAVADGRLTRNPVTRSVKLPNTPARPITILTGDDLHRFIAAAETDERAALWLLALYSALRPGELAALTWNDVDLDKAVVRVRRTRTHDRDGKVMLGDSTKSPAGVRDVPIPPVVVAALRRHADQLRFLMREYSGLWEDHGFVFPGRRGRMIDADTIARQLERLCERAGVPRLTPHGLRHSSLTLMASLGESPAVLASRAGHASVAFTLDRYVHPSQDDQRAASEKMERRLHPKNAANQ